MDKFEVGEIAIHFDAGTYSICHGKNTYGEDCEILSGPYKGLKPELGGGYDEEWYWCRLSDGDWGIPTTYLRKKRPPESKDIQETREKGAPSFDEMMRKLREGVCEHG